MRNGIGYIRISTQGQDDKFGKEAQREAITKYASEHGIKIVQWFVDIISGVKEHRPNFDAILMSEQVANPPYDCVLVFKSDRVARDIKLYFYYLFLLEKKGVELISINEDFNGELAGIYRAIVLFCAEQERKNIALRTSSGRRIKAGKGGYAGGRCPYGYDAVSGTLQINEAQASVVKMIYMLKDEQHKSYQDIADYLNDNHILTKSGKAWEGATVFYIYKNKKFYQGYIKYGKNAEYTKGEHEAIINEQQRT